MIRYCCQSCDRIASDSELLRAANPFDSQDELVGCPHCKQVEGFDRLCDEPECEQTVSCGWPSEDGYRSTCHKHSPWGERRK